MLCRFLTQIGTVDAKQQRENLFGSDISNLSASEQAHPKISQDRGNDAGGSREAAVKKEH